MSINRTFACKFDILYKYICLAILQSGFFSRKNGAVTETVPCSDYLCSIPYFWVYIIHDHAICIHILNYCSPLFCMLTIGKTPVYWLVSSIDNTNVVKNSMQLMSGNRCLNITSQWLCFRAIFSFMLTRE